MPTPFLVLLAVSLDLSLFNRCCCCFACFLCFSTTFLVLLYIPFSNLRRLSHRLEQGITRPLRDLVSLGASLFFYDRRETSSRKTILARFASGFTHSNSFFPLTYFSITLVSTTSAPLPLSHKSNINSYSYHRY